jgi:hypothetical protein
MRRLTKPSFVLSALWLTAATAHAAGVTLTGVVVRPAKIEAPASRHLGFLPPLENPIVELRQYDPYPEIFVFLEGGPDSEEATSRSPVVWQLESHSFSPALLPVAAGAHIEIANVGRETHVLGGEGADAIGKDPIGPGSSKSFTAPAAGQVVQVSSSGFPHLQGRIVSLPTRLFSRVDRNGKFKIENVPAGRWTVRVGYRNGWANPPARTIDVPAKDLRIDLTSEALAPTAGEKP